MFFKFGVPEAIPWDNGKQFASKMFEEMVIDFGIKHIKTPVYSPSRNAEPYRVVGDRRTLAGNGSRYPELGTLRDGRNVVLHSFWRSSFPERQMLPISSEVKVMKWTVWHTETKWLSSETGFKTNLTTRMR